MNETSQIEEMKRYLFYEMPQDEKDKFEESYFEDTEFFYNLLEFEQELIDKYAVGKLTGGDLQKFESSLKKSPERVERIHEAMAFYDSIEERKEEVAIGATDIPKEVVVATTSFPSFGEKISAYLKISTFKFAAGAVAIILLGFVGFTLYQNEKQRQERIAIDLEQKKQAEFEEQQRILREKKAQQDRINNENQQNQNNNSLSNTSPKLSPSPDQSGDNTKPKDDPIPVPIPPKPQEEKGSQVNLTFFFSGIRGGQAPTGKQIKNGGKEKAQIIIPIEEGSNLESVKLFAKGKQISSQSVSPVTKSVTFTIDAPESETEYDIKVTELGDTRGDKQLGSLTIKVQKTKKP